MVFVRTRAVRASVNVDKKLRLDVKVAVEMTTKVQQCGVRNQPEGTERGSGCEASLFAPSGRVDLGWPDER